MQPLYSHGDIARVKSLCRLKDEFGSSIDVPSFWVHGSMDKFTGRDVTIESVNKRHDGFYAYKLLEDKQYYWYDECVFESPSPELPIDSLQISFEEILGS